MNGQVKGRVWVVRMCFARAEADGRMSEQRVQVDLVLDVLLDGRVGEVREEEGFEGRLVIFEDLVRVVVGEALEREGRFVVGEAGALAREVRRVEVRMVMAAGL